MLSLFFTAGILIGGCVSPLVFSCIIHSHRITLVAQAYLFTALLMFLAALSGYYLAPSSEAASLESLQIP